MLPLQLFKAIINNINNINNIISFIQHLISLERKRLIKWQTMEETMKALFKKYNKL